VQILISLIILLGVITSTGCQANTIDSGIPLEVAPSIDVTPASTSLSDSPIQETSTPDRMDREMTEMPERVPPTEETTPITGEVPTDLLESIRKDLAERTGTAPISCCDQRKSFERWLLRCANPRSSYTQAFVNNCK
jgi:hypothetical protein